MSVAQRFQTFLSNIALTDDQVTNGGDARKSVIKVLNQKYWGSLNGTDNSQFVGSWAKHTRVRPPRDVDVVFKLPMSVYQRFNQRFGNKQSQLLQEVKGALATAFPSTDIKGDGPIVLAPFAKFNVEVIPAFPLDNGQFWVCHTAGGGSYKVADYNAEINHISTANASVTNDKVRHLIRMTKVWQRVCNVPLKSFHIELLAVQFLSGWSNRDKGYIYYDYMVRDFLAYLITRTNGFVSAPGTGEIMSLGNAWESKARMANARAVKACDYEAASNWGAAGDEWQAIFGADIPKWP